MAFTSENPNYFVPCSLIPNDNNPSGGLCPRKKDENKGLCGTPDPSDVKVPMCHHVQRRAIKVALELGPGTPTSLIAGGNKVELITPTGNIVWQVKQGLELRFNLQPDFIPHTPPPYKELNDVQKMAANQIHKILLKQPFIHQAISVLNDYLSHCRDDNDKQTGIKLWCNDLSPYINWDSATNIKLAANIAFVVRDHGYPATVALAEQIVRRIEFNGRELLIASPKVTELYEQFKEYYQLYIKDINPAQI